MTVLIGHQRALEALRATGAPVVLLLGPESVGKRVMATRVAIERGAGELSFLYVPELTAERAREAAVFTSRSAGQLKVVLIDMDGSSDHVQNILLKTLEEPPPDTWFILVASRPPQPTIISRSEVIHFGLLTDDQVESFLVTRCGVDPVLARAQAPLGAGRVAPALAGLDSSARARVSSVLRALAEQDGAKLDAALRDWDAESHQLLGQWAAEAAVERWRIFEPAFGQGFGQREARRILGLLAVQSTAHPQLAAHAALAPLVSRR
jgi:DNA polymerase III delta prime subunit